MMEISLNRRSFTTYFGAMAASLKIGGCGDARKLHPAYAVRFNDAFPENTGAGYMVARGDKIVASDTHGNAAGLAQDEIDVRSFETSTPFRAASISKLVPVIIAQDLARIGVVDPQEDAATYLGAALRNPAYPDKSITLHDLLSHRSTISDPDKYWLEAPGDIRSFITPDIFRREAGNGPGHYFGYANLNYGLAATILEAAAGTRFDRLARRYLKRLGLDAGFNWSGVTLSKRRNGATLYRQGDDGWDIQTDGPDILSGVGPHYLGKESDDLSSYTPGTNGTLFSPQGGLRASLEDLLVIANDLARRSELHKVTWSFDATAPNGRDEDGHFLHFGDGLYVYPKDASPFSGELLVGHHGEAYGLHAGLWILPERDIQFVYAVTGAPAGGVPMTGGRPNQSVYAQQFFDWIDSTIKRL